MNSKYIILVVLFLFFGGILGCDKIKEKFFSKVETKEVVKEAAAIKGPLVAKVNNISIGLEDFNQEIELYNANVPADRPELKITTKEQKVNYLKNEVVRRTLLYQDALDKRLDRNEDVVKALDKTKRDLLVLQLLKESTQRIEVSSKEVEDYYNTYKEQLKEPEERQVSEIMVASEQDAKEILIQLLQGADFATLAKERSQAASAKKSGDIGFIKKGIKSKQFDEVVFSEALDVDKISNIFKAADGYYIVKIEAKRGGKQKPLSEMWDDIKRGLTFLKQQKMIEEMIGKLSSEAKIEVYEGEIK